MQLYQELDHCKNFFTLVGRDLSFLSNFADQIYAVVYSDYNGTGSCYISDH